MESKPVKLDALDLRVLDLLQMDATRPVAEVAQQVASSKTVVWRRIQRLLDKGVIRARCAILDPEKVGLGVLVFAHVKMNRHGRDVLPRFLESVRAFPQVVECHILMGDVDFLLKIYVGSIAEYEDFFWRKLSKIDGVQGVSSSISMSRSINTTRLPLHTLR